MLRSAPQLATGLSDQAELTRSRHGRCAACRRSALMNAWVTFGGEDGGEFAVGGHGYKVTQSHRSDTGWASIYSKRLARQSDRN